MVPATLTVQRTQKTLSASTTKIPTFTTSTIAQNPARATLSSTSFAPTQALVPVTPIDPHVLCARWKHLLLGTSSFFEIADFIEQHPTFPKQATLCEKAEDALVDPEGDSAAIDKVVEFFDRYHPKTGKGQFFYAKALLAKGNVDQAKIEFYKLLVSFSIPSEIINQLNNYKQHLPFLWAYLHAGNLIYTKNIKNISAVLNYLTNDEKERITLRLDLLAQKSDAVARAQKMISTPGNNEGVIFELIRYYRRLKTTEATDAAVQLFLSHTFLDEEEHASIFWKERNLLARRMMDAHRPLDAYNLVKDHGFSIHKETHLGEIRCGEECAHAHCMTGWLALNYAKKPETALSIFQGIENVVKEAISKSRALYWIGASYMRLNQLSEAKKAFLEASTYSTTFYGQLAVSQIASPALKNQFPTIKNVSFKAVLDVNLSSSEKQAFEALELVNVIRSVPEATHGSNCDAFFFALLNISQTLEFQRQVFDLAESVKSRSYAILLSKKKHMTFKVAYPLLETETRKDSIERIASKSKYGNLLMPLSHAIIRRESGFDESALSGANARGMMQLVPATANEEARAVKRFGIKVSANNLYDKIPNIILGTSYIERLLTHYDGNLILSLAAYNAGEKPVNQWIKDYGDPRLPNVDIVDWIECIPYVQTRNYVQRVLENFIVYEQFLHEELAGASNQIGSMELCLLSYLKVV
eukprot:gene26167-34221_t